MSEGMKADGIRRTRIIERFTKISSGSSMKAFALDGVKMFHHRILHHANLALYTSKVFIIKPVIVIGPTPFGTGVMALTLENTAS